MLYLKENIVFSDKHYRSQAIEELEKLHTYISSANLSNLDDRPPQITLNNNEQRFLCFEYGVKVLRSDTRIWEAACVEQVSKVNVHDPRNLVVGVVNEATNIVENKTVGELEDFNFKFNINDNVVTSDGDTGVIKDRRKNKIKFYAEYFVDSNCEKYENRWVAEEELAKLNAGTVDFDSYIKNCLTTECKYDSAVETRLISCKRLLHAIMGLCTESGEALDNLKKHIFYGKELDVVNIEEELGDKMYYFAVICDELKLDLGEILRKNSNKLMKVRYKGGFSEKKAVDRDLVAERKVLES